MTDTSLRLSIEESHTLARQRRRRNIYLLLALCCFSATMFGVSITHLQFEAQMDPLPSQPITDK